MSKVYARAAGGRVEALVDVSFELVPGDMAVISGPSGSGVALGKALAAQIAAAGGREILAGLGDTPPVAGGR